MAENERVILGLDIGSTKIAAAIGQYREGAAEILGLIQVPSTRLRKGQIIDIAETVSALSALIEEAERIAQAPIEQAIVGIGGTHLETIKSKGVIAVARPDGEITQSDVDRVLEAARAIAIPANREIIHVLPLSYIVDSESGILDPVGMTGIRLEVDAHIISGASPAVKNLVRTVSQSGLELNDLVFSPLATALTTLTKQQKDSGVVLVDIGAGTTSLAVYEEGDLLHAKILPIGSANITNDIAIGLKTSIDIAEQVKIKYATLDPTQIKPGDSIDLSGIDPNELERPKLKYVAEIVDARMMELFMMIKEELGRIGKDGTLPSGIVLTGGGSQIDGLVEAAKNSLHLPARLSTPVREFAGRVDKIDNPTYATCVGLLVWGLENSSQEKEAPKMKLPSLGKIDTVVEKTKSFFQQFLP